MPRTRLLIRSAGIRARLTSAAERSRDRRWSDRNAGGSPQASSRRRTARTGPDCRRAPSWEVNPSPRSDTRPDHVGRSEPHDCVDTLGQRPRPRHRHQASRADCAVRTPGPSADSVTSDVSTEPRVWRGAVARPGTLLLPGHRRSDIDPVSSGRQSRHGSHRRRPGRQRALPTAGSSAVWSWSRLAVEHLRSGRWHRRRSPVWPALRPSPAPSSGSIDDAHGRTGAPPIT